MSQHFIVKLYPIPAPPKKERFLARWLYEQPYYLSLHRYYKHEELAKLSHERIAGAVIYEQDIKKAQRFENLDQAHGILDIFANWQADGIERGRRNTLFFQKLEIIKYTPETVYSGEAHLPAPGTLGKLKSASRIHLS